MCIPIAEQFVPIAVNAIRFANRMVHELHEADLPEVQHLPTHYEAHHQERRYTDQHETHPDPGGRSAAAAAAATVDHSNHEPLRPLQPLNRQSLDASESATWHAVSERPEPQPEPDWVYLEQPVHPDTAGLWLEVVGRTSGPSDVDEQSEPEQFQPPPPTLSSIEELQR
jgi:hypothetical protein